jgi:hypothetical protein
VSDRLAVIPRRTTTEPTVTVWDVCRVWPDAHGGRPAHTVVAIVLTSLEDAQRIAETLLLPLPEVPGRVGA